MNAFSAYPFAVCGKSSSQLTHAQSYEIADIFVVDDYKPILPLASQDLTCSLLPPKRHAMRDPPIQAMVKSKRQRPVQPWRALRTLSAAV